MTDEIRSGDRANDADRVGALRHTEVAGAVIDSFFRAYNTMGYGFFESVYCGALEHDLRKPGFTVAREVRVQVMYDGVCVGVQRIDMIVNHAVVVDVTSTDRLPPSALRQLTSYLASTRLEVGLLLHFGPAATFYRRVATNPAVRPRQSA